MAREGSSQLLFGFIGLRMDNNNIDRAGPYREFPPIKRVTKVVYNNGMFNAAVQLHGPVDVYASPASKLSEFGPTG